MMFRAEAPSRNAIASSRHSAAALMPWESQQLQKRKAPGALGALSQLSGLFAPWKQLFTAGTVQFCSDRRQMATFAASDDAWGGCPSAQPPAARYLLSGPDLVPHRRGVGPIADDMSPAHPLNNAEELF